MFSLLRGFAPLTLYVFWIFAVLISLFGKVNIGLCYLVPLLPLQNVVDKLLVYPWGKDFNDILLISMIIGWFVSKSSRGLQVMIKSPFNQEHR